MNTFASTALQGLSPFELVFARKPRQLTSFELPKLTSFPVEYREFFRLLLDQSKNVQGHGIGMAYFAGTRTKR